MLGSERRRIILQHAAKQQAIETQALADQLGVSLMTIRRDIKRLEQEGFIRQTYGGATVQITKSIELGFNSRALQSAAEKRLIGARAAELIEPDWCVFLGIGTTTGQVAQFLRATSSLLIVTSSLSHASLLSSRKIRVVAVGGALDPNDLGVSGPIAEDAVGRFHADICVLGAAGIDAEIGVTELDYQVAALHRLMIKHSRQVMLVGDHTKLDHCERAIVAPVTATHTLVTDQAASACTLDRLRSLGLQIVIAETQI